VESFGPHPDASDPRFFLLKVTPPAQVEGPEPPVLEVRFWQHQVVSSPKTSPERLPYLGASWDGAGATLTIRPGSVWT